MTILGRMSPFIYALIFFSFSSLAQQIPVNKYGLKVVESFDTYKQQVEKNSDKELIDLEKFIPGIVIDIKYATPDNFTKKILYPKAKAFVRLPVAKALLKIQTELKLKGLELKIFDGYRPYDITIFMWGATELKKYVANPKEGSRHNRGCAVDLTIIDSKTGLELEMPTLYDDFTVKAHHNYKKLSKSAINNRALLKDLMVRHGFKIMAAEWWHYDFTGWKNYELMNISFDDLMTIKLN
jgi:zinc D-Ala-D-Ala dipeptidase